MARSVLPIVGLVVGAMFGAPQLGFMIGSLVGNVVDPQVIKGPSIGDGQTQTSNEGVPRPIVYGTVCLSGNILDKSEIFKSIKRSGGKGGGPVTEEERMHMTYAIRVCEGPVDALVRIWEDEKLVLDLRAEGSLVEPAENNKYAERFRFFNGSEAQLPSADLEKIHGVGNTPAYRGTCYIVFPLNDVTDRRGSIPNYRFEVTVSDTSSTPTIISSSHNFDGLPGEYAAIQKISNNSYDNIGAKTSDKQYIFTSSSTSGLKVFKLNNTNLQYEEIQTFPSCPSNYGISLSNNEKFLVCKNQSSITTFLITSNGLNLIQDFTYNNWGGGTHRGKGLWFHSDGMRIIISTGTDGGPGAGLSILSFDDQVGLITSIREKHNEPFPKNEKVTAISELIYFQDTDIFMIRRTGNQLLTFDMDFNLLGAYNPVTPQYGINAGMNPLTFKVNLMGTDVVSRLGVFWPCGSDTGTNSDLKNLLINVGVTPATYGIVTGVTNNFVPSNEMQENGKVVLSSSVSSNKDYIIVSRSYTADVGMNNPVVIVYKKDGNDNYSIIQKINQTQINESLGVPTSGNTFNANYIGFSGAASTVLITGQYYLSSIIEDICSRCDLDIANLNINDIAEKTVRGFLIAQQYAAKNAISSLQQTFFFDPSEYDERINFINRGGSARYTLTENDLVDEPYEANRKSTIEYPKKLNLIYQNQKIGYDQAKAEARRNSPDVNVSGEKTIEVPVVFNENEAAQVCDKQLKIAWAEAQGEYKFTLPSEWDIMTPADIFGISLRGVTRRMRVEKTESAGGQVHLTAKVDRQSAYTSNVTALPLPEPTPPPPTITGPTQFAFLNIPALVDSNDLLGYYIGATGQTKAWYGAVVQRKHLNVEEEFVNVATIKQGNTMGRLLEPILDASEHYSDTTNVIHVQLYSGDFEAVNQDVLLRENNALALAREDGTAEIIQFRDLENLGNGEYKLKYLIRGRLNTVTSDHAIGTKVVYLEDVNLVITDASELGQTFVHRPISYGQEIEDTIEYTNTLQPAYMQLEFPVDLLNVIKVGPTLQVSWSPRERFGSDVIPVRSVNWQTYRVVYTDGTKTESFDVLEPEHSNDLLGYSGTVSVTVYQVNRYTGNGPGVTKSVVI